MSLTITCSDGVTKLYTINEIKNIPYLLQLIEDGCDDDIVSRYIDSFEMNIIVKITNDGINELGYVSLKGCYRLITFMIKLNISEKYMHDILNSVFNIKNETNIAYRYLIYRIFPEEEDDIFYIVKHDELVWKNIINSLIIPEIYNDPIIYIEMINYFESLDINNCYSHRDNNVEKHIRRITDGRKQVLSQFLINPHQPNLIDYFNYSPHGRDKVWKCQDISPYKKPQLFSSTIVNLETFKQRFEEFTCGLITKSINPTVDYTFPYQNVVFAGNSINRMLSAEYNAKLSMPSDLDMFIIGDTVDSILLTVTKLMDWFSANTGGKQLTYYSVNQSVVSIYIVDVNRKFQIISTNSKTPYDVINRFDMSHCQWSYYDREVFGTTSACLSMRNKLSYLKNISNPRVIRFIKTLYNGYDIDIDSFAELDINITDIVNDPNGEIMRGFIMDIKSWYVPKSDPMMDDDDLHNNICKQIKLIENSTIVTNTTTLATSNIVLCGNFDAVYNSKKFTEFNPAEIRRDRINMNKKLFITSKQGIIKLISDELTVMKTIQVEAGIHIYAGELSKEFVAFCTTLDTMVFPLFSKRKLTNYIINEHMIDIFIPKYLLLAQSTRKSSCLRDKQGRHINIESDLKVGDKFTMLFSIYVERIRDTNRMKLEPYIFINNTYVQEFNIETIDNVVNAIDTVGVSDVTYDDVQNYDDL